MLNRWIVAGFVCLSSLPVSGQSLELPDRVGIEGGTTRFFVEVETDDLSIEAYGFDVCHDGDLVSIDEENIVPGATIESLEFDSHVVTVTDDGWGVAAVLADGNALGDVSSVTPRASRS